MKRSANPELSAVERDFVTRAESIFRAYPELLCFCLEGERDASSDDDSDARRDLDIEVGLATRVSDDFEREIGAVVNRFISEALEEHPDAVQILGGRLFARTLH